MNEKQEQRERRELFEKRVRLANVADGVNEKTGLPSRATACGICGISTTVRKGGVVRFELHEQLEDATPPPAAWRLHSRRKDNPHYLPDLDNDRMVKMWTHYVTYRLSWRLCADCRWVHPSNDKWLPRQDWGKAAVAMISGKDLLDHDVATDASTVIQEFGHVAYEQHGQPTDKGNRQRWQHIDAPSIAMRMAALQAERELRQVAPKLANPCLICGSTGPGGERYCTECGDEVQHLRADTYARIDYNIRDWAASQAVRLGRPVKGLGERVAFQFANRHPSYRTTEPREPWQYMAEEDREALRRLVSKPQPREDGRLNIPGGALT